jgi:hypothetical protein
MLERILMNRRMPVLNDGKLKKTTMNISSQLKVFSIVNLIFVFLEFSP